MLRLYRAAEGGALEKRKPDRGLRTEFQRYAIFFASHRSTSKLNTFRMFMKVVAIANPTGSNGNQLPPDWLFARPPTADSSLSGEEEAKRCHCDEEPRVAVDVPSSKT